MKKVIYNYDNLKENEVDEVVIRCKGLIINDNNQIMLGHSHNTYQFPGGHLKDGETLLDCLKREIKEETGIELEDEEINKDLLKKIFVIQGIIEIPIKIERMKYITILLKQTNCLI